MAITRSFFLLSSSSHARYDDPTSQPCFYRAPVILVVPVIAFTFRYHVSISIFPKPQVSISSYDHHVRSIPILYPISYEKKYEKFIKRGYVSIIHPYISS